MPQLRALIVFFAAISANCFGQQLACVTNGGVNPPVRAEGLAELVGDFEVTCFGGTPTALGAPIPTVTVQIFLNTQITSRCLESTSSAGCLGLHSEALLILDEPTPATQYGCPTNTCANVGTGTGAGGYGPGSAGTVGNNKNIFQGIQTASNSITFLGIPIDPPGNGPGAQRIIRITNVRGNANGLGVASGNNAPTSITETITATPPNFMPVSGLATQAVGSVQLSIATSVVGNSIFQQSTPQNPGLANDLNSSGVSQFSLRFRELFSTAFKKRNIATSAADPAALANQNDLTLGQYNSESGFYNSSLALPFPAQAGLADSGARLMARFNNIPPGVSLFSRVSGTISSGGAGAVLMVNAGVNGAGPASPVTGNAFGIAPIPALTGAVYEVFESDPNSFATVDIPIYVAYTSPGLGTATVNLSYAPISTTTVAVFANVMRFADTSSAVNAFTIEVPHCATLGVNNATFPSSGGQGFTSVASDMGCQWIASTIDNWITALPSGPDIGSLNYTVAANNNPLARSGTIVLHFIGFPDQAFTINQAGFLCAYTVSPTGNVFSSAGGTGSITLNANSNLCPFPNTASNNSFLTLNSVNFTNGSGTVGYSVDPDSGVSRTGTLTIAGQTFTISQQGINVPSPGSLNSISGSGVTHPFVFSFSDPDGWQDLGVVNILINKALDGRNACYLAYDRPSNVLYLVGDIGGGLTALVLNGSGSVGNSQCLVDGTGSSASGSGNTLTLTLAVTFNQTTFSGEKLTYLAARDVAQNNSGWRTMGVWSVPRLAPVFPSILSATPSEGGGATQQFTVTYRDATSSANLRTMQLLINSDLSAELACYMGYDHASNQLYLVNDHNSGLLLPGIAPNSGTGTVENSQCAINGAATTKNETGTDLTLTISLTFKASFAGPKLVYTGVQTVSNANSDWHALGFWNVP